MSDALFDDLPAGPLNLELQAGRLERLNARLERSNTLLLASGEVAWARVGHLEGRTAELELELARQVNERMKDRALAGALLEAVRVYQDLEARISACACSSCNRRRAAVRDLVAMARASGLEGEDRKRTRAVVMVVTGGHA